MKNKLSAKKILVLLSRASVTHRNHLKGILEYVHKNITPPWDVQLGLSDFDAGYPETLSPQNYDGLIVAVSKTGDRRRVLASGIPSVIYEPTLLEHTRKPYPDNVITFFNDHKADGRTAAEYFLARGYENFAYVGTPMKTVWSDGRKAGYCTRLKENGNTCEIYAPPPGSARTDFTLEARRLAKWLKSLPGHTAIFVAHDERAREVILASKTAGRSIPADLAVLGVDDDELLCSTSSPSISSIAVEARETGIRFAKALEALLCGRPHERVVRTYHTHIVARRSTDAFSLDDPFLSRALSYAAANLSRRPSLEDLAAAAHCSKRTLQLRSRATLGRTIKEEISDMQVNEAKRRLSSLGARASEIAAATGFCNASHMYRRIREMEAEEQ